MGEVENLQRRTLIEAFLQLEAEVLPAQTEAQLVFS